MRYRIEEVKLGLDEALVVNNAARAIKVEGRTAVICDEPILLTKLSKKISGIISNIEIVRRSIDARGETKFVYTLDFDCDKKLSGKTVRNNKLKIVEHSDSLYEDISAREVIDDANDAVGAEGSYTKDEALEEKRMRPVVIGFGPCGMFCALVLARAGLKPIVIERGGSVDERVEKVREFWANKKLDPECNVQFGEGGAGTFSDGKLNTGIKDERIRFVLETFVGAGASPDILIDARPHIGTDVLRGVVKNIRKEIIALGGEIIFDTRMEGVEISDAGSNSVSGVRIASSASGEPAYIETDTVVLALGHSARETVKTLYQEGLAMEPKSFSMGVRVQHSQETIDRATYGDDYGHPALPPAYYKLSHRASDGRGVYSFCMCPGGEIVNAASAENSVVTNGMSNAARDSGYANSGILVDVRPDDYMEDMNPLSGMDYQEKYERLAFLNGGGDYSLPQATWGEYRAELDDRGAELRDNVSDASSAARVVSSLPEFVAKDIHEAMPRFGNKIKGFDADDTLMVAIESRSSSPVRILRDKETLQAKRRAGDMGFVKGLYPGGEGAGYAGGITSAACDGIRIAEKIIAWIKKN